MNSKNEPILRLLEMLRELFELQEPKPTENPMKLPGNAVEWYYIPTPGQRAVLTQWRKYYADSQVPVYTTQTPFVVVKNDNIRVAADANCCRLEGVCWTENGPEVLEFTQVRPAHANQPMV